jgi:hypothetical protein
MIFPRQLELIVQSKGDDVDLILGLDMMKTHGVCIDLERNALRFRNRKVNFLSEHELPDKAQLFDIGMGVSASSPAIVNNQGHALEEQPDSFWQLL